MAHEKVYGICENKCRVEVPSRSDFDYKNSQRYTIDEVDDLLEQKANSVHTHDDRYYTESETKSMLNDHIKKWEYNDTVVHKIAANSYGSVSIDASWSNHTILGIVGVQALGCIASFGIIGNKANVTFYNPTNSEITVQGIKITVLYAKNM